jgi:acyl-CoA synthetase (AMP-forming)/AMP-acid ligase II
MYPIAMIGVICAGGVFNPTPFNLASHEAARYFGITSPKIVFCSEDLLASTKEACEEAAIPPSRIYVVSSFPQNIFHAETGKSLIASSLLPWTRFQDIGMLKEITTLLHFTSGTTGLPKYCSSLHDLMG